LFKDHYSSDKIVIIYMYMYF